MAPSQLGIFTRSDPRHERANIQFHVQPLSLDKFGDAAAPLPGDHRQRLQSAADLARHRAHHAPPTRPTRAGDRAELSVDRRGPRGRRRRHPCHARADGAAGARRPITPRNICPGPSVGDDDASLAKAAGDIGTTIFHPVGTAKMGPADDPMAVVDAAAAGARLAGPARRRRLGDADDHLRQHQHADHDDRREGRRDDPGGCAVRSRKCQRFVLDGDRLTQKSGNKPRPRPIKPVETQSRVHGDLS